LWTAHAASRDTRWPGPGVPDAVVVFDSGPAARRPDRRLATVGGGNRHPVARAGAVDFDHAPKDPWRARRERRAEDVARRAPVVLEPVRRRDPEPSAPHAPRSLTAALRHESRQNV